MDEKEKPSLLSWEVNHKVASDISGTEERLRIMIETLTNTKEQIRLPLRQSGCPHDLRLAYKGLEAGVQRVIRLESDRLNKLLKDLQLRS